MQTSEDCSWVWATDTEGFLYGFSLTSIMVALPDFQNAYITRTLNSAKNLEGGASIEDKPEIYGPSVRIKLAEEPVLWFTLVGSSSTGNAVM